MACPAGGLLLARIAAWWHGADGRAYPGTGRGAGPVPG